MIKPCRTKSRQVMLGAGILALLMYVISLFVLETKGVGYRRVVLNIDSRFIPSAEYIVVEDESSGQRWQCPVENGKATIPIDMLVVSTRSIWEFESSADLAGYKLILLNGAKDVIDPPYSISEILHQRNLRNNEIGLPVNISLGNGPSDNFPDANHRQQ